MSIITLVRHGQASAGTDHYDRLSPLGRQQAQLLGQWWRTVGVQPDAVFAGSLERQQDTASLTLESAGLGELVINTLTALNEYDHHAVDKAFGEGFSSDGGVDLSLADYHDIMDRWRCADEPTLNGGEAWQAFMQRGLAAMQTAHETVQGTGHAVLFTSGGVIATLIGAIQSHPFAVIIDNIWNIRNASVSTLEFDGSIARLLDFNAVPHLDREADRRLVTQI